MGHRDRGGERGKVFACVSRCVFVLFLCVSVHWNTCMCAWARYLHLFQQKNRWYPYAKWGVSVQELEEYMSDVKKVQDKSSILRKKNTDIGQELQKLVYEYTQTNL